MKWFAPITAEHGIYIRSLTLDRHRNRRGLPNRFLEVVQHGTSCWPAAEGTGPSEGFGGSDSTDILEYSRVQEYIFWKSISPTSAPDAVVLQQSWPRFSSQLMAVLLGIEDGGECDTNDPHQSSRPISFHATHRDLWQNLGLS